MKIQEIFKKCYNICKDKEWKDVFSECTKGNFPYGMYIKENYIHINKDVKEKIILKEDLTDEEYYNILIDVFKRYLNLYSKKQEKDNWNNILNNCDKINYDSTKIKKYPELFLEYSIELKNKHNLTTKQTKDVYRKILLLIMIDKIVENDIEFENNKIVNIKKISIQNKKLCYIK